MKKPTGEPLGTNTDYVLIPLTRGLKTAISPEDEEWVSKHLWCVTASKRKKVTGAFYAVRRDGSDRVALHRLISGAATNSEIDHINGWTLDNRRCNLRFATPAQRNYNKKPQGGSSQYTGVVFCADCKIRPYRADISVAGKHIRLGHFKTEEAAARARDEAARKLHGKFARLNFPRKGEEPPEAPPEIVKQKPTKPVKGPFRGRVGRISQYVGVSPYNTSGKFRYRVYYKGKCLHCGGFATEEAAARARDAIIKKMGWPHPLAFPKKGMFQCR